MKKSVTLILLCYASVTSRGAGYIGDKVCVGDFCPGCLVSNWMPRSNSNCHAEPDPDDNDCFKITPNSYFAPCSWSFRIKCMDPLSTCCKDVSFAN